MSSSPGAKNPTVVVNTITPETTPSPKLRPYDARDDVDISPASPLPPPLDQSRGFSFDGPSERQYAHASTEQQQQQQQYSARPSTAAQSPLPHASAASSPPTTRPSTAPTQPIPSHNLMASPPSSPPTTPPFIPLTRQPIPLPASFIPPITPAQLNCYTTHRTAVWSNNAFQPMGCMVCRSNARDRKWACTWCQLRVCRGCCDALGRMPGRSLGKLLEAREGGMRSGEFERSERGPGASDPARTPGIVVSSADDH